jgi:hypothetical protein
MSADNYGFKEGLERGKSGKQGAQSLLDVALDSDSVRDTRQRGYEAGAAARAAAEAISENRASVSSTVDSTPDSGALFLIRKWFPHLFPWSEDDATSFILNVSIYLFGGAGLLCGLYFGYVESGVGAAIVSGLILGGAGAVAGFFLGFFGPIIVTMLLNAVIVLIPVGLGIWLLSFIWDLKF